MFARAFVRLALRASRRGSLEVRGSRLLVDPELFQAHVRPIHAVGVPRQILYRERPGHDQVHHPSQEVLGPGLRVLGHHAPRSLSAVALDGEDAARVAVATEDPASLPTGVPTTAGTARSFSGAPTAFGEDTPPADEVPSSNVRSLGPEGGPAAPGPHPPMGIPTTATATIIQKRIIPSTSYVIHRTS